MKKIVVLLLAVFLFAAAFSGCSSEQADPASDFLYEYSPDNAHIVITKYIGESQNVVVPSKIEGLPVTSLFGTPEHDFEHGVFQNTDVETVTLPETITVIGSKCFENCADLTAVTIKPDSELHTICARAFKNCTSLKEIKTENAEKLRIIEDYAFENCRAIEKIKFAQNLENIGKWAFYSCYSLKSVAFSSANITIVGFELAVFDDVPALEEIIFEEGCQSLLGINIFHITGDVNVTIPASVKKMASRMFMNSGSMKMTFLGDCPEIIDADQFEGDVTIFYDPDTKGWDTTPLRDVYTLILNMAFFFDAVAVTV